MSYPNCKFVFFLLFALSACTNRQASILDSGNDNLGGSNPTSITVEIEARVGNSGAYRTNAMTVDEGQTVNVRWSISGTPTSCQVLGLENDALTNRSASFEASSSVTYEIVCQRGLDNYRKSIVFTVTPIVVIPPAALDATLEASLAGNNSFFQNSLTIDNNQSVDLRWTLQGPPDNCNLEGTTLTSFSTNGSTRVGPLTAGTKTYRLVCSRGIEAPINRQIIVTVNPPAPPIVPTLEGRVAGTGSYSTNPLTILDYQRVDLKWSVQGTPDSCAIAGVTSDALASSQKNNIAVPSTKTFRLICQKAGEFPTESALPVTVTPSNFQLTITAGNTNFGSIEVNQIRNRTFTIKNTGNSPVTALQATDIGPFKSISFAPQCASLAVQASCAFVVRFAPTTIGTFNNNFIISYTGGGTNHSKNLSLQGQATAPPTPALQQNLLMSYDFDDDDSSDLGDDTSGNGNHANAVSLISSTTAQAGRSAYFAADDPDKMFINDVNVGNVEGITVSVWVKPEEKPPTQYSTYRIVYAKGGNTTLTVQYFRQEFFRCTLNSNGKRLDLWTADGSFPANQWYHVMCSFGPSGSGSLVKMNINGATVLSKFNEAADAIDFSQLSFSSSNQFTFGVDLLSSPFNYFFKGHMDELNIWTRALTDSEAATLYTNPDVIP